MLLPNRSEHFWLGVQATSERSWFRVLSGVGIAAWLLNRLELHKFDASEIGIVDVERPFAVAADFGGVGGLETVGFELGHCGFNFRDDERK